MHKSVYYVGTYLGRVSQCVIISYIFESVFIPPLSLFLSFLVSRFPKSLSLSVSLSLPFLRLWISWPTLMKIRSSNERGKGRNILNKKYGTAPIQTFIVKKIPSPLTYLLAYLQPPPSHPPSNRRRWQFKSKVPPWRGISCSVDSAGRGATRVRL